MNMIVALCRNRGIGFRNQIPWAFKKDIQYFRDMTIGNGNNAVIMGRKTWWSLPDAFTPLPKRTNIILSSRTVMQIKKKIVKHLHLELSTKELYLFGLQEQLLNPAIIYNQLTQIDTLHLTQTRLCQYLLNIAPNGCQQLDTETNCEQFLSVQKEIYEFDDFMALQEINWEQPITYTIPIGHKIIKFIYFFLNGKELLAISFGI